MGYYYYLLFVDGYSKSSVRSPLRQGSLGEMALEILSLVPRATWELRVIKVHFATAICSAGCLTLHRSSGCRCPCRTGDRESNKLQRGTLGIGKEEPMGRGMLGVSWNEDFIALFGLLLFCPLLYFIKARHRESSWWRNCLIAPSVATEEDKAIHIISSV